MGVPGDPMASTSGLTAPTADDVGLVGEYLGLGRGVEWGLVGEYLGDMGVRSGELGL